MSTTRLGELLLQNKVISDEQLQAALKIQKQTGQKLGAILISLAAIDENTLLTYLSKQLKIPVIDLAHQPIDTQIAQKLPENYARYFNAIYLGEENGKALLGMTDPLDIFATDKLEQILGKPLQIALVSENSLIKIFNFLYRKIEKISGIAGELAKELKGVDKKSDEEDEAIKQVEPSVLKLLNSLFEDAIQVGASDIHIEPSEHVLRIRLRVDGILQEQTLPLKEKHISLALSQRLKLMAGLNISEKRLPQDGRFEIKVRDVQVDVRLSTMPIVYGESIVMRLLTKSNNILDLAVTGMPEQMLTRYRQLIRIPKGIILVTGPTGSGKTTTLYATLSEINDIGKNIVTIEDPIEYRIERINQVQVNPALDLTFARVLRATLRQDPNIILVGEIRDNDTASIAMRAALTGHLVFATLHTNDAASTAIRLIDIGVEGYLVASTLRAVLAQRLARVICSSCTEPYQPSNYEISFFTNFFGDSIKNYKFKHGKGCSHCNNTGYKGRKGVFDLLEFDEEMLDALRRKDTREFAQLVTKNRNSPALLTNAFELAVQGKTTLSEVMRIAGE
jgi:MSHA biogenesis protein MshE